MNRPSKRRDTLATRFIKVFALVLVLPVLATEIVIELVYFSRIRDAALEQNQRITLQTAETIETEFRQIQILAAALVNNADFVETCRAFAEATDERVAYELRNEIDGHVNSFFRYTNKIGTVYLFFRDRELYYYRNYPTVGTVPEIDRSLISPAVADRLQNYVIPELVGVNPVDRDRPLLSIAISPDDPAYRAGFEAVLISFRLTVLDLIQQRQEPLMAIVDPDGRAVLAGPAFSAVEGRFTWPEGGDAIVSGGDESRYLVTYATIPSADWRLVHASDYESLMKPLRRMRWITLLALGLLFVSFVVFTLLFFGDLVRPLRQVIERMRVVETGDYRVKVSVGGPTELAQLSSAFNQMTAQIDRLSVEMRAQESEKNRYEMEALQYRIHPHFVANTLNSIRLMAENEASNHIADMSASLMRLVNESFNRGGRMIRLLDEMKSLRSYVHIMKVRFGETFCLTEEIDPVAADLFLLKMLLQPIVENAVLHGIRESNRSGTIRIAAQVEGGTLQLCVEDNGPGIDQEIAEAALAAPSAASSGGVTGIGLYNVHRRILLNYGQSYGIAISGRTGGGTTVSISLPVIENPDD